MSMPELELLPTKEDMVQKDVEIERLQNRVDDLLSFKSDAVLFLTDLKAWYVSQYILLPVELRARIQALIDC